MNDTIITTAGKFSSEYFTDSHLGQDRFMSLMQEALQGIPVMEDKVTFLTEVIRLSNLFLNESQFMLQKMEEQDLSKTGIKSLL